MKKLFAVLLVVFLSCFSLIAEDIPMDWYLQIVNALDDLESDNFIEWDIEKIDEKTVKVSNNKPAVVKDKNGVRDTIETLREYYFRFNLSIEEKKSDRLLFMEKAGELFSSGVGDSLTEGDVEIVSEGGYKIFLSYLVESLDSDDVQGIKSTFLLFCYELEGFTSLSHIFYYGNSLEMKYYKY